MLLRVAVPLALTLALAIAGYSSAQESADRNPTEGPAALGAIGLTSNHDLNIQAPPGQSVLVDGVNLSGHLTSTKEGLAEIKRGLNSTKKRLGQVQAQCEAKFDLVQAQLNATKDALKTAVLVIDEVGDELNGTQQVVVDLRAEVGELKAELEAYKVQAQHNSTMASAAVRTRTILDADGEFVGVVTNGRLHGHFVYGGGKSANWRAAFKAAAITNVESLIMQQCVEDCDLSIFDSVIVVDNRFELDSNGPALSSLDGAFPNLVFVGLSFWIKDNRGLTSLGTDSFRNLQVVGNCQQYRSNGPSRRVDLMHPVCPEY